MTKKLLEGATVGAIAAAIALLVWGTSILDRWELATWSWRVELFAGPGRATSKVKLILLDQASLDWGEKENGWSWPWPREVYCPIINFCKRSGARAVIFDVLYTEPSFYGVSDDRALGAAIADAPGFVAPLCLGKETGEAAVWASEIAQRFPLQIENLEAWLKGREDGGIVLPKATFPIPEVAGNATCLANVTDDPDVDGIFRRGYLFRLFDGRVVPSLGLAAMLAGEKGTEAQHSPSAPMRIDGAHLRIGSRDIPIDGAGRAVLRFRGAAGKSYETFSAASVIQSELRFEAGETAPIENPEVFKDCYVFLGFSAPGLLDLRSTPVSRVCPGVEIYATMLDNLLSDDFLRDAPRAAVIPVTLLLALCSGLWVVHSRKVSHTIAAFAVLLPLPALAGFAAYPLGLWWPIVVEEGGVALALVGAVVLNYATEGRQKAFIKRAFKYYLSPAVIERILEDPSKLTLGGERRELTIFFSDLQGFSSISERLDPQTLTGLLNEYLSEMTDIILEEGGTLDKYEGDAIIAFWNAPLTQADHARRACRAAIRCQHRLAERRKDFEQRTGVVLRQRIGMNTGEVVVGNMGSRKRFDYTVLGDAANLASRLEGANKAFGTITMVSEMTWSQVDGQFKSREIGLLRVVGRKTPVRVYELIDFDGAGDRSGIDTFERGLAFCYGGKWAEALQIFETLPEDPVAAVYAGRCRELSRDPSRSWDGVWNLTEK